MKVSRIKIKIWGYVQGVFFRYNTRKIARKLGLTGFVKNLPDGTVYITEPGAGSNPNSQSLTVTKSVTAGQLEWFQAYLDISNLIARRATDYPDTLCITIQPTTMGGNFALVGSQVYYLVCEAGGHAD